MEVTDRLVSYFFCLTENGVGFFIRLPENAVSLLLQLFLTLLGLCFQGFCFSAVSGDFFPFLFDRPPACLQVGEQVFKGDILFAEPLSGIFDNKIRQSQFAGDGESVTLSGNTDEQPVSRAETLYIEFTAGILHARRRKGVYLQLAEVCGRHCAYISLVQVREDGCGKGGAFRGVRAGSELVKEDQ